MAPEIELPADFAAMIESQAEVHGLSVEAFLRLLLEERESNARRAKLSPAEKSRLWREWAASHHSDTPPLSDEAISRESIYGERG